MEIAIGKDYVITSDAYNVILNKRYDKKDKAGNDLGEEALKQIGYYPNLIKACTALLNKEIKQSDAKSVDELFQYIDKCTNEIVKAISKYN